MNYRIVSLVVLLACSGVIFGMEGKGKQKLEIRARRPEERTMYTANVQLNVIEGEQVKAGGLVFTARSFLSQGKHILAFGNNSLIGDLAQLKGQIVLDVSIEGTNCLSTNLIDEADVLRVIRLNELSKEWKKETSVPRIIGQKLGESQPSFSIVAVGDDLSDQLNLPVDLKVKKQNISFVVDGWLQPALKLSERLVLPISWKILDMVRTVNGEAKCLSPETSTISPGIGMLAAMSGVSVHNKGDDNIILQVSYRGKAKYFSLSIEDAKAIPKVIRQRYMMAGVFSFSLLLGVIWYFWQK